ncbi:MAG: VWA domain-containing protein [Pyrinomonadaceae bacterium]
MLAQVESPQNVSLNKKLQEKLLKLREKDQKRLREDILENRKSDDMLARMKSSREKNTLELCPILKEFGWPTIALVGPEAAAGAFMLLKNSSSLELQKALLPVIVAATKKGEITKSSFAGYVDRLRLGSGLKQLFGTQTTIMDGFLVLYPIADESLVETRRKQFELEPLADYLRFLERSYRLPLVKAPGRLANKFVDDSTSAIARATAGDLFEGETLEENQVVRISTELVSLNVSVYSENLKSHVSTLKREDFTVFEDGKAETLGFFATTDVPFDLVLLIDLSGSTAGKRGLIHETTRRFVNAARPADRIAIVTFSDDTQVISPLTADHEKLLASIAKIEGKGGSNVWDALKFTLDQVVGPNTLQRRRAVVFMTDGADSALLGYDSPAPRGSLITFANLLEAVRNTDTLIIPVYLDTEGEGYQSQRLYENARKTLALLAEESGGLYYKARKLEDLNGIYTRVIEDLGKIYSLGYKPTNQKHDASWRSVKIQIANRPDLVPRTKPGYYAN